MVRELVHLLTELISLALALTTLQVGRAATYSVVDLGRLNDLSDQSEAAVNDVNSSGGVTAINATNGSYRAFLYGGLWTNLGTLGGTDSYALGINDSNVVAGYALTTGAVNHAFCWIPGATNGVPSNPQMQDLGTLGGDESLAFDINASGQAVGVAQDLSSDYRACRFNNNATITNVGALLPKGSPNSFGYGINDAGYIVGTAYDSNFQNPQAFFYNGTNATLIGDLTGSGGKAQSEAFAVNNNNQIVGYAINNDDEYHAFRWKAGTMTDLGTLGGTFSEATAINNSNVVVGNSTVDALDTIIHAFIASSTNMVDLNTLLDNSGNGWVLITADGINDTGLIVGTGTTNSQKHGFLLTPIRPVLTAVNLSGEDVRLSFTTITNATYFVESRTNFFAGNWINVLGNVAGTGGTLTRTNLGGATNTSRYYRVRITVP